MKRLSKDQKASILLATRDAVFQQIADAEEHMTDEATEEALRYIEKQYSKIGENDDVWDAVQCKVQDELKAIFSRIYDATKKGEDR